MNNENCPCCHNHCDKDKLKCDKGKEYFNSQDFSKQLGIKETIINDLRKCGHFLHHNKEVTETNIFRELSEKELNELHLLLSKICNNINI